MKKEQMVVAVR